MQLLELARNIVRDMSPRVSAKIGKIMVELVQTVDEDEALLRDRVEINLLENNIAGAQFILHGVERGAEQGCAGTT